MPLNLNDFRKASTAAEFKDVDCPQLGGTVRLAKLRPKEHIELLRIFSEMAVDGAMPKDKQVDFFLEVLALTVVDDAGAKIFASADGREVLAGLDIATLIHLGNESITLHNFGANKEVAKKNSKRCPKASSRSGSRSR